MADILRSLRAGIGAYKRQFAEGYIQSRLGMSYDEFYERGRSRIAEDVYREISFEIKNHHSGAELIVAGFLFGNPVIFKIGSDTAWSRDDFAVIGSGTTLAEWSLFHRNQSFLNSRVATVYNVYEAKRLAEKDPHVGRGTQLSIARPNAHLESISENGLKSLEKYFCRFGPRRVKLSELPPDSFYPITSPSVQANLESSPADWLLQPPSPESHEETGES